MNKQIMANIKFFEYLSKKTRKLMSCHTPKKLNSLHFSSALGSFLVFFFKNN